MKIFSALKAWLVPKPSLKVLEVEDQSLSQENLDAMWHTHVCPNCKCEEFYSEIDGAHDLVLECYQCHRLYGMFDTIRRVEFLGVGSISVSGG